MDYSNAVVYKCKPADYSKAVVYKCKVADYSKVAVYKCKAVDYSKVAVYKCKVVVYKCKLAVYTSKVLNSRFTTVLLISLLDTVEVTPFFQFFFFFFVKQWFTGVNNTLKSLLMHPKDKISIDQKKDLVYHWECKADGCNSSYIG